MFLTKGQSKLLPSLSHGTTLVAVAFIMLGGVAADAEAQLQQRRQAQQPQQNQPKTVKGKLTNIEKKGRALLLTVTNAEGQEGQFAITPRTPFVVTAKGDDGFLTEGQFVSATPVMTNDNLFAKEFTVHLGPKSQLPQPGFGKAPKQAGLSVNAYQVAGEIVSRQQDEEYADYETLTIDIGKTQGKVFIDKGHSVRVATSDPTKAKPGAPIELELLRRGNRVALLKATVKLNETWKAEEVLEQDDDKRSSDEETDASDEETDASDEAE